MATLESKQPCFTVAQEFQVVHARLFVGQSRRMCIISSSVYILGL